MKGFKLSRLDVFPKFDKQFEQDARYKTATGGVFSVITFFVMALLVVGEVRYFLSVVEQHEMLVDPDVEGNLMITIDLTVHQVPCDILTVTAVDAFGGISPDSAHSIVKESVKMTDKDSRSSRFTEQNDAEVQQHERVGCPSCYGAAPEGECCHTCKDLRLAYERKGWVFDVFNPSFTQCSDDLSKLQHLEAMREGCRIHGSLNVPRVTGSLHILPGRFFFAMGQRQFNPMTAFTAHLNLSHTIHELNFGESFPGQLNPLAGSSQIRGSGPSGGKKQTNGRFSYFLQVIPTRFESRSLFLGIHTTLESQQYSATQHFVPSTMESEHPNSHQQEQKLHPGIFISYDLSPIKVHIRRQHPYPSFTHLVLQLCAVCGGVLTVAGLLDALCFHGIKKIDRMRKNI